MWRLLLEMTKLDKIVKQLIRKTLTTVKLEKTS